MSSAITSRERLNSVPDGYTFEHDDTIWNVGHVFRWSDVYNDYLDCGIRLSIRPEQTIAEVYEREVGEPMFNEYDVFFVKE